ncbi:MAG: hypothetical protein K9J06_07690 [Flavobacteriales bacterium]|nr:hypothetical protein [Flavobacteriales bacterium]
MKAASFSPAAGLYFSKKSSVAINGTQRLRKTKSHKPRSMYAKITVMPKDAMLV